jgi:predicted O-methyltransferase YrrM
MSFPELLWLYTTAKDRKNIVEIGSWKGRSTHAIASGTSGVVTAVDTWKGSSDPRDLTHTMAKQEDVFEEFKKNTSQFNGKIKVQRGTSLSVAKKVADKSLDWVFIDAGHTKDEVLADIEAWLPKVKKGGIISGHDYKEDVWMGVVEAVNEAFPKLDGVEDTIWYKKV